MTETANNLPASTTSVPVVAIGASAGGLTPLMCFLNELPRRFGFALVFIQHLSTKHKSILPELIQTRWPDFHVADITDGMELRPGVLYICPPGKDVRTPDGIFRIADSPKAHLHLAIDEFFAALAEDAGEQATAVIFSGAGTDGARGAKAIRDFGGTVFVQDPETAEFPSMPLAAIDAGQADAVLSAEEIAREITKLLEAKAGADTFTASDFDDFYGLICEKTGNRFHHYKQSVVARRIRRRMYLRGISSVREYLGFVAANDSEAATLASDLMIGVTSFFRDRLAWKALKLGVVRKIASHEDNAPIRVWSPACSTGEEAYSVAMMFEDEFRQAGRQREITVFATDLNERVLEKAREGIYPASITADVPSDYMRKYFSGAEDGRSVVISKPIREKVVFARQDLLTDPPFSRLDLILCRNFLIYLEPNAQEKCISLFHYALKPDGYLFLGNAESVGRNKALFRSLPHKKCRIYQKTETLPSMKRMPLAVPFAAERQPLHPAKQSQVEETRLSAVFHIQESLLEDYAPVAIAITRDYEIFYHSGPTNRYLRQPRGVPTHNLMELLPKTLHNRIKGAIYRATQEARPVSVRASFHAESKKKRQVTLRISRLDDNLVLIVFLERGIASGQETSEVPVDTAAVDETAARQIELELSATRAELQNNIEQLKSLNEELQSSNEELQAANEELETSREELQSLNEELITVNSQLQTKIEEQEETNNDLSNFFTSTNIPTIFLDHEFRVRRFTPAMSKLIKLIPTDIGRPIVDMSQDALGPDFLAEAREVLESLVPVSREFSTDGTWYVRTSLPYRTADNRIEGVVTTYSDITNRKRAEDAVRRAKEEWELTFDTVPDLIAILDCNHTVRRVNKAMADRLGLPPEQCIGLKCHDAVHGAPESPAFCPHALTCFDSCEHVAEVHEPRLGGDFIVSTTPLFDEHGALIGSVHVARDITERKAAETERELTVEFLRLVNESRNTDDLVHAATEFFQRETGCEAVGIRIRHGHDYPYYETRGFPQEFVEAESRLCACDKNGNPMRDGTGNPVLECMCGNVICGRFDRSKPFFSERGNFWTNSTTELLASTSEADRQARTRNRCNGEGYESVALIGLSLGEERLGLLQLNDKRTGRFSPASMSLWERLADYLAVALAKFETQEALRKSERQNEFLADIVRNAAQPFGQGYPDGRLGLINQAFEELTGYSEDELRAMDWAQVLTPSEWREFEHRKLEELLRTGKAVRYEKEYVRKDGSRVPIELLVHLVADPDGKPLYYYSFLTDITERRKAEEALRESEQRIRMKLDSILSPEGDIGILELRDILDAPSIQSLMDKFHELTSIPLAIIDLKGEVLVGAGWQDICTKFHRVHPETCGYCIESDTQLTAGMPAGEYKLYKCRNNMWDVATPIEVGGKTLGHFFTGQFLFDDESPDYEFFRQQAKQYGFDESGYLAALDKVPRLSRTAVDTVMQFFMKLSDMISRLSYSNIKLARSLAERESLMAALSESEERLSRAQEIAHLGSWELDLTNNSLTWSDEVYRIFGLKPREFGATYEAFLDRVHPDDRAAVDDAYASSIRENRDTYEIEHRIVRADTGDIRWVHEKCEHFRDSGGAIIRSTGMVHDITGRKEAEEIQGRLAAIVESAEDAIIGKDLNGIIQTWNAGAETMFGYAAGEVIGRSVSILLPPEHPDDLPDILARIKKGEHIENIETVHMRKDGTTIPVSITFSAVRDAGGRVIGASKIVHDITERKRAEAEIQKYFDKLRANNEELQRFNRAMVDRELRMIELKKEVNELRVKAGEPARYRIDSEQTTPSPS